jgi:hypothetical protein
MQMEMIQPSQSKTMLWAGRILTTIVVLFLLMDGTIKVMQLDVAVKATVELGYPQQVVFGLGVMTLVIAVLYAIPQTAILGAILMTGLLGGAIATHLRVGSPLFSHLFFGVYVGVMAWGGLWLRDGRLRLLLPFQQRHDRH